LDFLAGFIWEVGHFSVEGEVCEVGGEGEGDVEVEF